MERRVSVVFLCLVSERGGAINSLTSAIRPMSIMREKDMKKHSKKQLMCTESGSTKRFDIWKVVKSVFIWGVKAILRTLLMRPATWKWVMVILPEFIEKLDFIIRDSVSFLIDLFA